MLFRSDMRIAHFTLGDHNAAIELAVRVLKKGGVIVFPTDTIYGLGGNACDTHVVEQIFKIKKRPLTKALPILARNLQWVKELAFVPPKLEPILEKLWPSQTTVIMPKKDILPHLLTAGGPTVGIRVPDSTFIDGLLKAFGYPLVATSANISGDESKATPQKIAQDFKKEVWKPDLILDAGVLPSSLPSTILDLSTITPRIIRTGARKAEDILSLFNL